MTEPFLIEGPALISFSGGRTSAYMLWRILQAHGGTLPDDVHVTFANTGKEREETLRFVHDCATHWNVRVRWLEWRTRLTKGVEFADRFDEVGFNSANRDGEPFAELIRVKGYTPNSVTRFCTDELKIKVMRNFMQSLGYERWTNVIGLRHDEKHRVDKSRARSASGKERWVNHLPLDDAKVANRDVRAFWRDQPFDLQLLPFEGNCDGCFLKARPKLWEIERTKPGTLQWWSDQEELLKRLNSRRIGPFRKPIYSFNDDDERIIIGWESYFPKGGGFRPEHTYRELINAVHRQPDLFAGGLFDFDPEMDAECGTWCEEAA